MTEMTVTKKQMAKIDQHAIHTIGIPSMVLMERAALSVLEEILSLPPKQEYIVVSGIGNNGGDGVAIARMLYLKGKKVSAYVIGEEQKASKETEKQLEIARNSGVMFKSFDETDDWSRNSMIIDALFGIGLNRNVEGDAASVIRKMNQSMAEVVAVDISSGLSADTGKPLGLAVKANRTVTFGFKKRGMTLLEGKNYSGKISVKDIGYPKQSVEYGIKLP